MNCLILQVVGKQQKSENDEIHDFSEFDVSIEDSSIQVCKNSL